ncbi:hypothetical protein V496_01030 [Pseudogymnoascus sp. VKM F-4515 (FW-2607)]|nr:hypothetical protein V496_01030 [Pseudogymnoascus sp. VKM F-4515 (FW-2607)]KFY83663.1 hypothetical protein V498_07888 [Pseudogymnoascus sp. VKM F-4517 (FW-2822)]
MANLTGYNIALVSFVCLGGYTYGYAFAIFATSIGQPGFYLFFKLDPASSYTASIIGAVNSLFAAGAAFGAISQGWLGDWLGRKKAFIIAAALSAIGGALTAASQNVPMIIVVRFIQGVGLGQLISLVPCYIAEVAPPHRRGALGGLTAVSFATGYVIAAWIGYLAWVDRNSEAWAIMQRLHHDPSDPSQAAARAEFFQITEQVKFDKTQKAGYIEMFRKPSWRKRAILVMFLMFASQSAGILGITNFVVLICQNLGLKDSLPLLMYAVYTVVATIPNFLGALFMDKIGRRKLLLIGFPALGLILLAEALLQRRYVGTADAAGNGAALLFIFLYAVFYGFCLDPAQFVWCSEVFPTTIRAKGNGLTFFAYFVGAITYTTPGALAFRNIGWKMYMVWFACSMVSTVIIYFFIPETSNMSLEEIGALFGDPVMVHLTADGHGIVENDNFKSIGINADGTSVGHLEDKTKEESSATEEPVGSCLVSLSEVGASNSLVASTFSARLVAVFVAATNGIGELTLKQFAKHTVRPRIYYIGQSPEAGDGRAADLKSVNPDGEYLFVKADLSLMSNVDAACNDIKDKEKTLNHQFFAMGDHTTEDTTGLTHHFRALFLHNLLPLLQASYSLRRVVTIFTTTQYDRAHRADIRDLRGRNTPLPFTRSHATPLMTPSLVAALAPNVSFANCFHPHWNWEKFKVTKPNLTMLMQVKKAVLAVIKPLLALPAIDPLIYCYLVEPGACNLFLTTSARYPASMGQDGVARVPADSIATGG